MDAIKNTHGGARRETEEPFVKGTFNIRKSAKEALTGVKNQSKFVSDAIVEKIQREKVA